MHALLLATANTEVHVAAPPDAGEPASVPGEILVSALQGELQKVAKWLRKGGPVNALLQLHAVRPQPSACCTPPLSTASWRWRGSC